jgi:hypothetical protein
VNSPKAVGKGARYNNLRLLKKYVRETPGLLVNMQLIPPGRRLSTAAPEKRRKE